MNVNRASARAHRLGDSIDTDMIIAGRHLGSTDPEYLARHCLAAHMPDFHATVSPADVLFAGWNFGCGSSRETAPLALKATGLGCVVAKSFARIYFRSSVNIGFPALVCGEAVDAARPGDPVEIDLEEGGIVLAGRRFQAEPLPSHVLRIVEAGGLVPLMAPRLGSTYPMTLKGRHNEALGLALAASATGSLIGYFVLFLLIDSIGRWVLMLGPPEMFVLIIWGIALIAVLSEGKLWKGCLAGVFGLLAGTVGISAEGLERGTLGSMHLLDGIPVVPAMIGLFAASELFNLLRREYIVKTGEGQASDIRRTLAGFTGAFRYPRTIIRGGLIGVGIGAVPGIGAAIASLVSYATARRQDSNFGKGDPEGIIAAESANSSSEGGSLGTLLALGLPGGSAGAVMLGALAMHNVTGGPRFLAEHQGVVYAIIIGNFIQVLVLFVIGLAFIPLAGRLVQVPARILVPIVLMLTVLGSYALTGDISGPVTVVVAGFAGFFLTRYGFPVAPMVIGLLLGRAAEGELLRSYQLAGGDISFIFTRPLALALIASTVVFLVLRRYLAKARLRKLATDR